MSNPRTLSRNLESVDVSELCSGVCTLDVALENPLEDFTVRAPEGGSPFFMVITTSSVQFFLNSITFDVILYEWSNIKRNSTHVVNFLLSSSFTFVQL